MHWWLNVQLALKSIRSNLLRSILTILIIASGIAALVGILTSIDGIKSSLVSGLSTLGANTFTIRSAGLSMRGGRYGEQPKAYPPVTYEDVVEFKERYDFPSLVSINTRGTSMATVKHKFEKTNPNITVMGVDENYLQVSSYQLSMGRNFSNHEIRTGQNTAILGYAIAGRLFGPRDSIVNQQVTIGNVRYNVIGVLKPKGASMVGTDNLVLVPAQNARKVFKVNTERFVVSVAVDNPKELDRAVEDATGLFRVIRKLNPVEEEDFEISRSDKLANTVIDNLRYVQYAAVVIGIVTLLAAGIGLMNIMLVAVSERTREIGISKAIGATNNVIVAQFLSEAVVICQLGGLFGIALGILFGNIVSILLKGSFFVPWDWVAGGIVFCFIVGIAAGIYPALKASKLDPIEALRHE